MVEAKPLPPGVATLPPASPLPMPEQSLWETRRPAPIPAKGWALAFRRGLVASATVALTGAAAYEMYEVLKVGGLTVAEGMVLGLFVLLFAWIAFSFVSTLIGFVATLFGPDRTLDIDSTAALPPLSSRTALLLPIYNEEPHRIMSRLQAIYESLGETGQLPHFEFFVLSDSTDPDIWVREEAAFLKLVDRTDPARVFYRHRPKNVGRKAGNIAEWVQRFGGRYEHMIVLDADSLMTGDTIVRLVAAMEKFPRVGLIQTPPIVVNGDTLFARIQQFAGRVYGPTIARGIAWWHGSESNYWGHNAIIRVRAFAESAGLPLLAGPKPFGGHILSHDFVEAALMRRAGWAIHMTPHLRGSYEECPPTLTDFAARDRRWCQGNLQHVGVLPGYGLRWISRLHLLMGIGSYLTSPLWLLFLLLGIVLSLQAQFIRPEYFPKGFSLFPQWPAQDPVRAAWVFAGTMAILFLPKLLGCIATGVNTSERRGCGGGARLAISTLAEAIMSALIAPIMMLMQSRAVFDVLLGRDAGWLAQRRGRGTLLRSELVKSYGRITLLGAVSGISAYVVSPSLFLWTLPVIIGLLFAIPIAAASSSYRLGIALRSGGLLLVPEEQSPPTVLARANALASEEWTIESANVFQRLCQDMRLLDTHRDMLPAPDQRKRGAVDVDLVVAMAKLDDVETLAEAAEALTPAERFAVLSDRRALEQFARKFGRFGG
jgi:membrane glycosyltransferase